MTTYSWLDHDNEPLESDNEASADYREYPQEANDELASQPESEKAA